MPPRGVPRAEETWRESGNKEKLGMKRPWNESDRIGKASLGWGLEGDNLLGANYVVEGKILQAACICNETPINQSPNSCSLPHARLCEAL